MGLQYYHDGGSADQVVIPFGPSRACPMYTTRAICPESNTCGTFDASPTGLVGHAYFASLMVRSQPPVPPSTNLTKLNDQHACGMCRNSNISKESTPRFQTLLESNRFSTLSNPRNSGTTVGLATVGCVVARGTHHRRSNDQWREAESPRYYHRIG